MSIWICLIQRSITSLIITYICYAFILNNPQYQQVIKSLYSRSQQTALKTFMTNSMVNITKKLSRDLRMRSCVCMRVHVCVSACMYAWREHATDNTVHFAYQKYPDKHHTTRLAKSKTPERSWTPVISGLLLLFRRFFARARHNKYRRFFLYNIRMKKSRIRVSHYVSTLEAGLPSRRRPSAIKIQPSGLSGSAATRQQHDIVI